MLLLTQCRSLTTRVFCAVLLLASSHLSAGLHELKLEGLDGSRHTLSDYIGHGRWVVLNIWGTRCPPCQEEMPELVLFHENHKDHDAIVVGIAIDFPGFGQAIKKEVSEFADEHFVDYPLLLSDGDVTRRLGLGPLKGVPTTYMFNPAGELAGYQLGAVDIKSLEQFIHRHSKKR